MKVCILTPRFPFPENGGDVLRINSIARYLKSQGHFLILISFVDKNINLIDNKKTKNLYDEIYMVKRHRLLSYFYTVLFYLLRKPMQCGFYHSRTFSKELDKLIKNAQPDIYIAHLLRMVPYLEEKRLYDNSIVEMTDALSKTYSLSNGLKKLSLKSFVYKFEKNNIARYEQKVIETFKKVVLVSKTDCEYLGNKKNITCYTNGITFTTKPENYKNQKISFVGNMRTLQNQDAVMFFLNEIFPLIRIEYPDLQFHIVGAEPPKSILRYHDGESVFVTGFVDSVEDYISDSCLLIAPVRIAAGIQNKVLIGLATGVPVVLTSLIAQSIPELVSGENCLIADSSIEIAEACKSIIGNVCTRNSLAKNGYDMVVSNYSWNAKLNGYEVIGE